MDKLPYGKLYIEKLARTLSEQTGRPVSIEEAEMRLRATIAHEKDKPRWRIFFYVSAFLAALSLFIGLDLLPEDFDIGQRITFIFGFFINSIIVCFAIIFPLRKVKKKK